MENTPPIPPITVPLIDRLTALFPEAKKTTLRTMLESKRVLINGAVARSMKQPLAEKDKVEVLENAAVSKKLTALSNGLKLLHFDADIIIVDKPVGLLTSTDADEKRPTAWRILNDWFKRTNNKSVVHLIHRLDRDASGLLVFARTPNAYESLKSQFFEHTITRRYDVIVYGSPKPAKGRLENLLLEDERDGVVHITKNLKLGKLAILDYETISYDKARNISRLACTLFTGRKHQIRVQFFAAGHGVCGDPVYRPPNFPVPTHRLALHATHLSFTHPRSKKTVTFDSPMPGALVHLFR